MNVLGSFQCRGIQIIWVMTGPAVLAAGARWPGCFFLSILFLLFVPSGTQHDFQVLTGPLNHN